MVRQYFRNTYEYICFFLIRGQHEQYYYYKHIIHTRARACVRTYTFISLSMKSLQEQQRIILIAVVVTLLKT